MELEINSINIKDKTKSICWVFLDEKEIVIDQEYLTFDEFEEIYKKFKKIVNGGYILTESEEVV